MVANEIITFFGCVRKMVAGGIMCGCFVLASHWWFAWNNGPPFLAIYWPFCVESSMRSLAFVFLSSSSFLSSVARTPLRWRFDWRGAHITNILCQSSQETPFISCQVIPFWKNGENNKRTERAARKWKVVPRITDDLFMEMGQTVYAERLAKRLTFPFREFTKPSLFQTLSI